MEPGIQEAVATIQTRMERRLSGRREDLDRELKEQRLFRERKFQATMRSVGAYLDHLSGIYQKIVAENNPFTKKYFLDAYTSEAILGMVHDSINYLESELSDKQTGRLDTSNRFRIGDLEKLGDLRNNNYVQLINLLKDRFAIDSDRMAEDNEIYEAVGMGFVEVSPEGLSSARANVSKANSFLIAYNNSSWLRKLKLHRRSLEKRAFVDPERQVELDYVLTPLGMAAVLPTDKKYVGLAEQERIFEEDWII
jgi:hypothetical protein